MEVPMLTVFNEVKSGFKWGKEAFHESFNSFLALYEIVYPSMKIDVPSERIQKLDTRVQFIDRYRTEILTDKDAQVRSFLLLKRNLQTIFEDVTEDEADPSLWWVIISTGSIIILTLSYVGWRKYKGDREKSKNRS